MPQPHVLFRLPSDFDILVRVLLYAAGTALSALGGFHGYRGYRRFRGLPFANEQAKADQIRDEFVFGDDLDQMYDENPAKLDGDGSYRRALAGQAKSEPAATPQELIGRESPLRHE
ncbi:MAG TPA: hypothetical protein VEF07_09960 [Candidatus Binataceae bacterium]|nr:hypothetical protein [Candidatus Binataceae bacterium]